MNMKTACSDALAELAREEVPDYIRKAYGGINIEFGRDYLIPKPFDKRIFVNASSAVAHAAMNDGVARKPLEISKYRETLAKKAKTF